MASEKLAAWSQVKVINETHPLFSRAGAVKSPAADSALPALADGEEYVQFDGRADGDLTAVQRADLQVLGG